MKDFYESDFFARVYPFAYLHDAFCKLNTVLSKTDAGKKLAVSIYGPYYDYYGSQGSKLSIHPLIFPRHQVHPNILKEVLKITQGSQTDGFYEDESPLFLKVFGSYVLKESAMAILSTIVDLYFISPETNKVPKLDISTAVMAKSMLMKAIVFSSTMTKAAISQFLLRGIGCDPGYIFNSSKFTYELFVNRVAKINPDAPILDVTEDTYRQLSVEAAKLFEPYFNPVDSEPKVFPLLDALFPAKESFYPMFVQGIKDGDLLDPQFDNLSYSKLVDMVEVSWKQDVEDSFNDSYAADAVCAYQDILTTAVATSEFLEDADDKRATKAFYAALSKQVNNRTLAEVRIVQDILDRKLPLNEAKALIKKKHEAAVENLAEAKKDLTYEEQQAYLAVPENERLGWLILRLAKHDSGIIGHFNIVLAFKKLRSEQLKDQK